MIMVLAMASIACSSHDRDASTGNASSPGHSANEKAKEPTFVLKARLELRPLADHSEFAVALTRAPLPPGVETRMQTIGLQTTVDEVVITADELSTLQAWAAEFADTLPSAMQVAYEATAPTKPVTLANPMHKGWQLHFLRTDDGFVIQGATGEVKTSVYDNRPEIEINLTDDDAERFSDLSEHFIGRKLAIVQADHVLSAPLVREQIGGGSFNLSLGSVDNDPKGVREMVGKLAGIPPSQVVLPASLR